MIGCDGGRSQVRKSMNVEFSGFTYDERFLILSTRYDFGPFGYALTNYIADPDEWCALFKVPGHDERGIWRVVFPGRRAQPGRGRSSRRARCSGASRASTARTATTTSSIATSTTCISASPHAIVTAASSLPAMPRISTIRWAAWA